MAKTLKEIIRWATYLSLFAPLVFVRQFFFPFVGPKSLYFFLFAEIIFFCWLILVFNFSAFRPKKNIILIFLSVYLLILLLSTIFGVNPSYSFWSKHERMTGLLMHLHLFGFFLALSSTFDKEEFKKFFVVSIFVAILSGLIGISNVKEPTMRGGGMIGNESFLGTYLLFNCFFALYLYFSSLGWKRNFGLISFIILTVFLLLTGIKLENQTFLNSLFLIFYKSGARAAKISLYGGIAFLFLLWLTIQKKRPLKILGLSILIPSAILISFALYSIMFQPNSFFRHLIEKEIGSFGGRFYVWEIAQKGFFDKPLLGWGPENFEFAFQKYFNPCFGQGECGRDVWYDRAHNVIFDTLTTTGILGLISYFFVFFSIFYVLWKNFLRKKIDFWEAGIFTSLFVAYFIQNLTVFDMVSSYLMLFLTIAFVASLERKKEKIEVRKTNFYLISILSALFLVSVIYFVILPVVASTSVISALNTKPFTKERFELEKKAIYSSPIGRFQIRQFFTENLISTYGRNPTWGKEVKEEFDFLVGEMEKNVKECNLDFRSYLELGQLLNLYARIDPTKIGEAERVLRKAIEVSPHNQRGYWQLTQTMLFKGDFNEAIALAQKAVDLEKNLETSHAILIQVLKIAGKKDLLRQKYEEAININPAWERDLQRFLK
jgi:O-antigen ligase